MIDTFYLSADHSVKVHMDGPLLASHGPVLKVYERNGDNWWGTPGSWYAADIARHAHPIIYIDAGAEWALTEEETAKLVVLGTAMLSAIPVS